MLTVDFPVISDEPGPMAPAGNLESHFQLPSKFLANAVSSGAGVGGAGGAAGAAAGAAAAGAGVPFAAGALAATGADAGLAAGAAAAGAGAATAAGAAAGVGAGLSAPSTEAADNITTERETSLMVFMGPPWRAP